MDKPIKYIEVDPLPKVCQECKDEDCGECDFAGLRWVLSPRDELKLQIKWKLKQIERLNNQVEELKKRVKDLDDGRTEEQIFNSGVC